MDKEFMKKLASIEEVEPDEVDALVLQSEATENDGTLYSLDSVVKEREEKRKYGDLHVRLAASLHKEIVSEAKCEGVSLNQYVSIALAYYSGRQAAKN